MAGIEEKVEQRIQFKSKAALIVALAWTILSGILFYLGYRTVNSLGLYTILSLITFVIHVSLGFALKGPGLLSKNFLFYPFGIILALILNEISLRWTYADENIIGFGMVNWIVLLLFYFPSSVLAFILLRLTMGYETIPPNPISSYSYYVKSAEDMWEPIELLSDYIRLFENVSLKINERKERAWMKFEIMPNRYAIAFVPENEREAEVNLFAYRMRSDTICEADKEEADVIVSTVDALFGTKKKQGYIHNWRVEDAPKHRDELKEELLKEYINRAKMPLKLPSVQQVRYESIDWLKKNRNRIISIAITAIISPLIVYLITSVLP